MTNEEKEALPSEEIAEETQSWNELGAAWRKDDAAREDKLEHFGERDMALVRERTSQFSSKIRRRNWIEAAAGALVVGAGIYAAGYQDRMWGRLAGISMALGAVWVVAVLFVRGGNRRSPDPSAPTSEFLAHERAELARQASLLETVWLWYLAPFLPTIAMTYGDRIREALGEGKSITRPVVSLGLTLVVFVGIHFINRRAARKLRAKLRYLE